MECARACFGTKASNRTMTVMDYTAIRLTKKTIDVICEICYEEHPDLCMLHDSEIVGTCTPEQVLKREDCRMYLHFVKLQSLYSSTIFMMGESEEAKTNTRFRTKELCKRTSLRTVWAADVTKQHKLSVLALHEEIKFLKYFK